MVLAKTGWCYMVLAKTGWCYMVSAKTDWSGACIFMVIG